MCPGTQGVNRVVSDQPEGRDNCLDRCFSNFSLHWNHPEGLFKHRFLGHTPRVSDSLGWKGSKMCISNKLPGDNKFFICGPPFEKQWLRCHQQSISEEQAKVPHKRISFAYVLCLEDINRPNCSSQFPLVSSIPAQPWRGWEQQLVRRRGRAMKQ